MLGAVRFCSLNKSILIFERFLSSQTRIVYLCLAKGAPLIWTELFSDELFMKLQSESLPILSKITIGCFSLSCCYSDCLSYPPTTDGLVHVFPSLLYCLPALQSWGWRKTGRKPSLPHSGKPEESHLNSTDILILVQRLKLGFINWDLQEWLHSRKFLILSRACISLLLLDV